MKKIALFLIMGLTFSVAQAQDCAKKCKSTASVDKSESAASAIENVKLVTEVQSNTDKNPMCCSAKMASTEHTTKVGSVKMVAEEVAALDENIEKKVDSETGKISFYRSYTCTETSQLMTEEVTFNESTQTFESLVKGDSASTNHEDAKVCCQDGKCKDKQKACCADSKTE